MGYLCDGNYEKALIYGRKLSGSQTWDVRPRFKRLEDSVVGCASSESKPLSSSSGALGCAAIEWRRCRGR